MNALSAPILHIDFETRGVLDLKKVGLHRYARDPQTDVWCMAWALDEDRDVAVLPQHMMARENHPWATHVKHGGHVVAHNAPFELEIWNEIMVPRYGWPRLAPEQTYCTMAQSYAMGLPGALEDAALALGLHVLKDAEGRALMLRMCRPRSFSPEGAPIWWDEADKLQRLYAYCQQDVRVERELHKRLMPLSEKERKVWLMDYAINQRGVAVDVTTAQAAVAMTETVKEACNLELGRVTGGAVQTVTALSAMKEWMSANGVPVESLAKQAIADLLNGTARVLDDEDNSPFPMETRVPPELPADVRQALILRQESGKASTAKLDRLVEMVGADGRLRNMYQYHGAATGRWAGRGVQTANLPRDMPEPAVVEKILALVRAGDHDAIDMLYGPPLTMISKCLRSFFVAPPGHKLIHGDWSNVEGRGQAWFAGEQWKLDAFVAADNKTGPGLYELAVSRMFGVPVETIKNPSEERQIGKVSELAFGYQGGIGSFHTMAKAYPEVSGKFSDAKVDEFKHAWRAAHPRIKYTWKEIENAAISAVHQPGDVFRCGYAGRQAAYRVVGSFLWCLLPSGRAICYPYPKLLDGAYGPQLTYMTVPSEQDKQKGKIIYDPKNASNWARVGTYGGSLFNNIVQGFCRDFLVDCMLPLHGLGARIVLHTYDDINVEVAVEKAEGARAAMQTMMRTVPEWAKGFPLFAKCSLMARYGKD